MQRNVILAVAAALVTIALVGVAAIPAAADQAGTEDTENLLDDRNIDVVTDTEDSKSETAPRSERDDESVTADLTENQDDGTEIGSLVKVGSVEKDDERGEDQLMQLSDKEEHREGSSEDELIKIGEGEDDVSVDSPPDRDDNTIEVLPFGM